MDKRSFLRLCSSAIAGALMRPLAKLEAEQRLTNWAGNIVYGTERLQEAASVEQARSIVQSESKLKVLGTRHCFNSIADSHYNFLSLKPMRQIELDAAARAVTVEAGGTYGQLGPYLDSKGFALHNLASLPHISVVGACMTA